MGERSREVPAGSKSDGRRTAHEEVHVGTVLVCSPALLQVSLHCIQSLQSGAARKRGCPEWKGQERACTMACVLMILIYQRVLYESDTFLC